MNRLKYFEKTCSDTKCDCLTNHDMRKKLVHKICKNAAETYIATARCPITSLCASCLGVWLTPSAAIKALHEQGIHNVITE